MNRFAFVLCAVGVATVWLGATVASAAEEPKAEELLQFVIGLVNDPDKDLRALGFDQIRTAAPGAEATKLFAALLPGLAPEGQVGLLRALADRGDPEARPAVLTLLDAQLEPTVRIEAINAIGKVGHEVDVPMLVRILSHGTLDEQSAARNGLIQLRGSSVPGTIVSELPGAATPTRVAILAILLERRAVGTVPDILVAAIDDDAIVREAAMTALGQMAGTSHIPGMLQGVLKAMPGAEQANAEKAVMFVCQRIKDGQPRDEPLLAARASLKEADQLRLLPTVGRVGGKSALQAVEAAIANPTPNTHDMGIRSLCNWPDASIAPRLIELFQIETHTVHQTLALKALIRVAPLPDGRPDPQRLELLQTVMAMCTSDADRNQVLRRARSILIPETLRFVLPYIDQPVFTHQVCETVVELAHHRTLRDANKVEFHQALDKVIAVTKDEVLIDRANRYKLGQTWNRRATPEQP